MSWSILLAGDKAMNTCEIRYMPATHVDSNINELLKQAGIKQHHDVEIVVMKNQVTILRLKKLPKEAG